MIIELDMYQTLAIAVVVLMLGKFLRKNAACWKSSASLRPLWAACCLLCSPACAM